MSVFVSSPKGYTGGNYLSLGGIYQPKKKRPQVQEIGTDLKDMQEIVGGYIQEYQPFDDAPAIICNEEGKMMGLTLNRAVYSAYGKLSDIVARTFFICNATISSDTFQSLSEEQLEKYEKMFYAPERFYPTEEGIKVHKINLQKDIER